MQIPYDINKSLNILGKPLSLMSAPWPWILEVNVSNKVHVTDFSIATALWCEESAL